MAYVFDLDGVIVQSEDDFWWNYLPMAVAKIRGISKEEAQKLLIENEKRVRGKLLWSDVHFWADVFGIDVLTLKNIYIQFRMESGRESGGEIYQDFLKFLSCYSGRWIVIATASNSFIKEERLRPIEALLREYGKELIAFDSSEIKYPKNDVKFWDELYKRLKKEGLPPRYVVDDRLDYLEAAAQVPGVLGCFLIERHDGFVGHYRREINSRRPTSSKITRISSLVELL